MALLQYSPKFWETQVDVEAWDRFQFVQRSTGVPQSSSTDHGNVKSGSRHDRCNHQRRLVAHSTGGMFIHFRCGQIRPIEHHAGMKHRFRQRGKLCAAHPAPNHSHQPRSNLIVGNMPTRNSLNEKLNLFAGKFRAVALFADEVNNSHVEGVGGQPSIERNTRQ